MPLFSAEIVNNQGLRAPDKVHIFISNTLKMPISLPNPLFDHLLESSHQDDSNKCSNIGFGEEITQVELIKVHFMLFIWSSDYMHGLPTPHISYEL